MVPHARAATLLSMVLDPAEARNYWRALLDNATQLIADATLLYNADSHGRARALTVLAEEELGKATSVYDLFSHSWSAQETEPLELEQRSSRDHLAKYISAFEFGRELEMFWGDDYPDTPEDDDWERWYEEQKAEAAYAARAANLQKQRGFYVDMANGEMTTPRDFDVEDVAEHQQRMDSTTRCSSNQCARRSRKTLVPMAPVPIATGLTRRLHPQTGVRALTFRGNTVATFREIRGTPRMTDET